MTRRLEASGCVELAAVERSGLIESRHLGAAVVLSPLGEELLAFGDVDALVFPRSSLKPFQAAAVLRTGVALDEVQTVLATASHAGTPEHLAVVERMLRDAGLDGSALQCPSVYPVDPAAARHSPGPSRLAYNCSGKHAGFLAACVHAGWDPATYLDPAHPVQRAVAAVVEEYTGHRIEVSGVDGCGAPVHAVTVRAMARGISRLVRDGAEGSRIASAVRAHPWAIESPGGPNTVAIERCGIVAKGGAEGFLVAAASDGTTVALKMLDGANRATTLVALSLLARVGAVDSASAAEVIRRVTPAITGGGESVGEIRLTV
ncbi:MAG: asparaginase [Micrococcales bacterium]|nr:asparaginase [Micrococcales bacterium]